MPRSLDYYYLFQAYELLGQRLYGRQWTGQEYLLRNLLLASPDELIAQRQPLESRIAQLITESGTLDDQIRRSVSKRAIRAAERKKAVLMRARVKQHDLLNKIREPDEGYRRDFEAQRRHKHTEARMFEALRKGELIAHAEFSAILPSELWNESRGFKAYPWLSIAVLPRARFGLRRASIGFPQAAFNAWLANQVPIARDDSNPVRADVLCRDFLRLAFSKDAWRPKEHYWAEAKKSFPKLSRRTFDQVWTNEAPQERKEPGRRAGT